MIKRTIFISSPMKLYVEHECLKLENLDSGDKHQVPLIDIGIIELDYHTILLNNYLLKKAAELGIVIINCNDYHNPVGIFSPLFTNTLHTKVLKMQFKMKKPLKNQIWKELIKSKIENQAALLEYFGKDFGLVAQLAKEVKSNDNTKREGVAASYYWKYLLGLDFKRERYGKPPNAFLNYGYTLIRSTITRALVSSGLHPSVGVHHKNQYNHYCLADDLIEPFRIFCDKLVYENIDEFGQKEELTKEDKIKLLEVINTETTIEDKVYPLQLAVKETVVSYLRSIENNKVELKLPKLWR